jgi:hypothetical protein
VRTPIFLHTLKYMIHNHCNYMRIPKTLTVEESVLAAVERTKGHRSTSERVNELLKRALELERHDELEREAALFYSPVSHRDRREERAFQKASLRWVACPMRRSLRLKMP